MTCPKCKAKLMPVDGEMFCLQCGILTHPKSESDAGGPKLEDTVDPLLRRAITDASEGEVHFRLPISGSAPAVTKRSFVPLAMISSLQRPVVAGNASGGFASQPHPGNLGQSLSKISQGVTKPKTHVLPRSWIIGALTVVALAVANLGVSAYYVDRVYPGVRLDDQALGGSPLNLLHQNLGALIPPLKLTADVNGLHYPLDMTGVAEAEITRLELDAKEAGHDSSLPIIGLFTTLFSKPLVVHYQIDDVALGNLVRELAGRVNHISSEATPMIVKGQVVVVSEKSGHRLDEAKAMNIIREALGKKSKVSLSLDKVDPSVTAAAYKLDTEMAQTTLGLNFKLTVRKQSYSPTAQQVGEWIVFNGPGKGISINGAGIVAYVNSIPGSFDKKTTANVLLAAVVAKQNLTYTAPTRKTTTASGLPVVVQVELRQTYSYCLESDKFEAGAGVEAVLARTTGWSLNGKVAYRGAEQDCNFTIHLMEPRAMGEVSASCLGKSTCELNNNLIISLTSWIKPPTSWKTGTEAYQAELVNHVVGHWLGFDHAVCGESPGATPVLQTPAVITDGCSPNWYAVPVELQGTKVLSSF